MHTKAQAPSHARTRPRTRPHTRTACKPAGAQAWARARAQARPRALFSHAGVKFDTCGSPHALQIATALELQAVQKVRRAPT
eukprot:6203097-Pleurochrysis_carterae.AAC.4